MTTIEREWLKKARTEKGITMKEMARRLDISESYYCFIENGERQKKMDVTRINGLSAVLGIPAAEIMRKEIKYAEGK